MRKMYYFSVTILLLVTTSLFMVADLEAAVTGKVYRDFNNDRTFDGGDIGVSGITVIEVDEADNTVSTTPNRNGDYALNIGGCTGQTRATYDIEGYNDANKYYRANLGAVFEEASNAYVWEFDPTTNNFIQVLQYPLNYPTKDSSWQPCFDTCEQVFMNGAAPKKNQSNGRNVSFEDNN